MKRHYLLVAMAVAVACAPAHAQWSKKQTDPQGAAGGANAKGAALNWKAATNRWAPSRWSRSRKATGTAT